MLTALGTLAAAPPTTRAQLQLARRWRLGLAIAALAFLVRLIPAVLAYGTSDVSTWELLGRLLLSGDNFYATQLHNWPVLWIYFCAAAVLIHDATGLPFFTLIKLPPIAADATIAFLLYRLSARAHSLRDATVIGLAYALNPVAILISGYHGQFDSLMLAPTLLACSLLANQHANPPPRQAEVDDAAPRKHEVSAAPLGEQDVSPAAVRKQQVSAAAPRTYEVSAASVGEQDVSTAAPRKHEVSAAPLGEQDVSPAAVRKQQVSAAPARRRVVAAALALGLGIWFKPVPLLLLPILLPRLPTWRNRALFTVLAMAPATLGTLPYFVRWPTDVATNFFGYSSWFGQWGYPVAWMVVEYVRNGTIPWWLPDPDFVSRPLHLMYLAGRFVLVAALAGTWWLIYRHRLELLRAVTATFAVFYAATSGFGVQYLLWIVPFATARRDRWLWPFTITATVLLVVAYALGLAYMPLDTVPDNAPNAREFIVKLATLPTWIVSILWAWTLLFRR